MDILENILIVVFATLMCFVTIPGILVSIPEKGHKIKHAVIHAGVYFIVFYFILRFITYLFDIAK